MQKNVFITGVSSGIGLSLAHAYLSQGCEVYGMSRREPAQLIADPRFYFCSADLNDQAGLPQKVRSLLLPARGLDLVILNAGVLGKIADMTETTVVEINQVMAVNVWANKVILDTLFTLPFIPQQVVAISSGSAASAHRGWNGYAISKASLNMLIGLYAAERPETHFCALAPGIIDTPMQDQISALPIDERFPSLELLREAKGTSLMPGPDDAVQDLMAAMERASRHPSGAFLDVNTLLERAW